ncbi:hypothetical protein BC831DRAFT_397740 [Entophlyctis helioformis]|nr:hypothetical protein BC831DRAFT_397740 [Entophlyctis helioformis]
MSGPSHHMRSAKDADLSPNTRMLLKSKYDAISKLSYSQQRFLDGLVSDAGSLPPRPTASMHQQPGTASPYPYTHGAATPSHAASDRDRDGSRTAARAAELAEWRSKPGIRTLEQIKQTGSYEPERFRTRPLKNMDTEKQRFQDLLEGVEAPKDSLKAPRRRQCCMCMCMAPVGWLILAVAVQQEIAERRQWLDDMIALGRGDQFKRQIQAEIALRVSRLEQIHKERLKQESGGAAAIHAT